MLGFIHLRRLPGLALVALWAVQIACGALPGAATPLPATDEPSTPTREAQATAAPSDTPGLTATEAPTRAATNLPATGVPGRKDTPAPFATGDPAVQPNLVCVAGLYDNWCISDNGWKTARELMASTIAYNVPSGVRCGSGLLVVGGDDIGVLTQEDILGGLGAEPIRIGVRHDFIQSATCDTSGRIWLASNLDLARYDGAEWVNFDLTGFDTSSTMDGEIVDLAARHDGSIWALIRSGESDIVVEYRDGTGEVVNDPYGIPTDRYLSSMQQDRSGRIYILNSSELYLIDGDRATHVVPPSSMPVTTLFGAAVDNNGVLWVATMAGLYRVEGEAWTLEIDEENGLIGGNEVRDLDVDDKGRVWVATQYGLMVHDEAGWLAFRMDNSPLDKNGLSEMVVIGAPSLPADIEHAPGGISGAIQKGGQPVANADFELCVIDFGFFGYEGATPCSNQPFKVAGQTDAEGRFSIEDLPVGEYVIFFHVDGGWVRVESAIGLSKRILVESNKTTDVGVLSLKNE